jgi:hypothetical protein
MFEINNENDLGMVVNIYKIMKSTFLIPQSHRTRLLSTVIIVVVMILLNSCLQRDNNVYGTWKVIEGQDEGAIYKFTNNDRLYIFNKNGANTENLYEFFTKDSVTTNVPGRLDEQGRIKWEAKDKIQYYLERKYSETDLRELIGPVFIITESSKLKLKIDEMEYSMTPTGEKPLEKSDEKVLVPFTLGNRVAK